MMINMNSNSFHSAVFGSGFFFSNFWGEMLDVGLTQDQVVPEERDEEEIAEKEHVIEARYWQTWSDIVISSPKVLSVSNYTFQRCFAG